MHVDANSQLAITPKVQHRTKRIFKVAFIIEKKKTDWVFSFWSQKNRKISFTLFLSDPHYVKKFHSKLKSVDENSRNSSLFFRTAFKTLIYIDLATIQLTLEHIAHSCDF